MKTLKDILLRGLWIVLLTLIGILGVAQNMYNTAHFSNRLLSGFDKSILHYNAPESGHPKP